MSEMKKEYTNGELTIVWKPKLCIHAKECVNALPQVYDPVGKPWIKAENATTEELKAQIKKCPSGALSYYMNDESDQEEELPNGPLLVYGTLSVKDKDGNTEKKNKTTAFCRCGASNNKPYCDGSHIEANFKD